MKKFLLAGAAALALTWSASAATITADDFKCEDGSKCWAIHLEGAIEPDDYKYFDKTIDDRKIKKAFVALNSNGGEMVSGLMIGLSIARRGFDTHVSKGAKCLSMCAAIWMAGAQRVASTEASIGFHQIYYSDGRRKGQASPEGNALMRDYYIKVVHLSRTVANVLTSATPDDALMMNDGMVRSLRLENVRVVDEEDASAKASVFSPKSMSEHKE
jgi:hypothetical protein